MVCSAAHHFLLNSIQTGATALYAAAQNGHLRVVELLIAAKAQVDIQEMVSFIIINITPRLRMRSKVYGSVFVCLSVCLSVYLCRLLQLLQGYEVQVRVSIGF